MAVPFKTVATYIATIFGVIVFWVTVIAGNKMYWTHVDQCWGDLHQHPTNLVAMAHPIFLAMFGIFLTLASIVFILCITGGSIAAISKNITVRGLG